MWLLSCSVASAVGIDKAFPTKKIIQLYGVSLVTLAV